jgi:hypothetical protein
VCPATAADSTATPTPTATATTQASAGPTAAPQVSFTAAAQSLEAPQCTILSWQTFEATAVTLDGAPVELSGSRQVCPTATQTWTLLASNAAGNTARQVSIQVRRASSGPATATFTPLATTPPAAVTPRLAAPTPVRPIVTQAPRPLATVPPGNPALFPTPGAQFAPLSPTPLLAFGDVPLAPTAQPPPAVTPTPAATATPFIFSPLPTETPRPRRTLGPDEPTPTPILVARAAGRSGQAPGARAETNTTASTGDRPSMLSESRRFSSQLLPGYAAYLVSVGLLLALGWYVLRGRNGRASATVRQTGEDEAGAARTPRTPGEGVSRAPVGD